MLHFLLHVHWTKNTLIFVYFQANQHNKREFSPEFTWPAFISTVAVMVINLINNIYIYHYIVIKLVRESPLKFNGQLFIFYLHFSPNHFLFFFPSYLLSPLKWSFKFHSFEHTASTCANKWKLYDRRTTQ